MTFSSPSSRLRKYRFFQFASLLPLPFVIWVNWHTIPIFSFYLIILATLFIPISIWSPFVTGAITKVDIDNGKISVSSKFKSRTYSLTEVAVIDKKANALWLMFPDGCDAYIQRQLFEASDWDKMCALIVNSTEAEQDAAANP